MEWVFEVMRNRRVAWLAGSFWLIGMAMDLLAPFRMLGTPIPASLPVMGGPVWNPSRLALIVSQRPAAATAIMLGPKWLMMTAGTLEAPTPRRVESMTLIKP